MDFGTGEYIILCNFDGGIMSDFKVFERGAGGGIRSLSPPSRRVLMHLPRGLRLQRYSSCFNVISV